MCSLKNNFDAWRFLPDKLYFSLKYFRHFRRVANFTTPSFFSEKIFLRMMAPLPIYSILADRVQVRNYIKSVGCEEYLVPLVSVFDRVPSKEDLIHSSRSFVLKKNNSCGDVICVSGNSAVDYKDIIATCECWLSRDYSDVAREKHYSPIKPKIIMEKFLGENIADYKMHIFQDCSGKYAYLFQVIHKGLNGKDAHEILDQDWATSKYRKYKKLNVQHPTAEKPALLESMKEVGRKILGKLDYLRIDFFIVGCRLYVGEVTVTPMGGGQLFEPISYDRDFFLLSS